MEAIGPPNDDLKTDVVLLEVGHQKNGSLLKLGKRGVLHRRRAICQCVVDPPTVSPVSACYGSS